MSYSCPHRPAYHESETPVVATPVAVFAGVLYTGASGGSGVNGCDSGNPEPFVHLRLN